MFISDVIVLQSEKYLDVDVIYFSVFQKLPLTANTARNVECATVIKSGKMVSTTSMTE